MSNDRHPMQECFKKQTVEWELETNMLQCLISIFKHKRCLWIYGSGHAGITFRGNDLAERLAGKAAVTSGFLFLQDWSVMEHEAQPVETKSNWSHHWSPGGERHWKRCFTTFTERTRKSHHQSVQHWKCFKGSTGETSERWVGAPVGFPEHEDTNPELNC